MRIGKKKTSGWYEGKFSEGYAGSIAETREQGEAGERIQGIVRWNEHCRRRIARGGGCKRR